VKGTIFDTLIIKEKYPREDGTKYEAQERGEHLNKFLG
jgi:hypothetical protein